MSRREPTVVGLPIPGFAVAGITTSEDDWVVTGSYRGVPFRKYVTPNIDAEHAMRTAVAVLRLDPSGIEWIRAERRRDVEHCVRLDGDWLRSRAL